MLAAGQSWWSVETCKQPTTRGSDWSAVDERDQNSRLRCRARGNIHQSAEFSPLTAASPEALSRAAPVARPGICACSQRCNACFRIPAQLQRGIGRDPAFVGGTPYGHSAGPVRRLRETKVLSRKTRPVKMPGERALPATPVGRRPDLGTRIRPQDRRDAPSGRHPKVASRRRLITPQSRRALTADQPLIGIPRPSRGMSACLAGRACQLVSTSYWPITAVVAPKPPFSN